MAYDRLQQDLLHLQRRLRPSPKHQRAVHGGQRPPLDSREHQPTQAVTDPGLKCQCLRTLASENLYSREVEEPSSEPVRETQTTAGKHRPTRQSEDLELAGVLELAVVARKPREMDSLEQLDLSGCGALRRMPYLIKWPNIFSLFLPIKCEMTRLPKKIDLGPLREISTPGLFSFHEASLPVSLQKLSMWEAEDIEFNKDWVNLESLVIGKFKSEKLSTMGRLLSLKELTIC